MRHGNYGKLAEDGFVPKDTFVDGNDVIIGKVTPLKGTKKGVVGLRKINVPNEEKYRDLSKTMRANEKGCIDKVHVDINGDGYRFVKVRVRSEKIPVIGDKFSSRHGQKGTCGLIIPAGDMPFTADGIQPDIIINPHAIPSRMTIAQLIECVLGKEGCMEGRFVDATPFQEFNIHSIGKHLEDYGMERWGNEVMYSGITGEQMECNIFIGPTF